MTAMNDDYLWDRSGEPDPDVERLERQMAPLAQQHPPPPLVLPEPAPVRTRWVRGGRGIYVALATAATLAIVAGGFALARRQADDTPVGR